MPTISDVWDAESRTLRTAPFDEDVELPALAVPCRLLGSARKDLATHLLNERNTLPIVTLPEDHAVCSRANISPASHKLVLLARDKPLSDAVREWAATQDGVTLTTLPHRLGWSGMSVGQVLRALLPADVDPVTAFEVVGHIAHVNLIGSQLPFKHLIGAVLLEKNPSIAFVVNKVGSIHAQFRTFDMEVVASRVDEPSFEVEMREQGCRFAFDYRGVYWNSRLSKEHERVCVSIMPYLPEPAAGQKRARAIQPAAEARAARPLHVLDACAGVGPFAVPLAKHGALVTANDLNPESHRWLVHNARKNKLTGAVRTHNLDARACIREHFTAVPPAGGWPYAAHVLMNLPASALQFCDVFARLFQAEQWRAPASTDEAHICEFGLPAHESGRVVVPRVHCYCFSQHHDTEAAVADVTERLRAVLEVDSAEEIHLEVRLVRDVGPNKVMCLAQFNPPVRGGASPK